MINALEKVVYPNGKTQSLAEIGGAVEGLSALIDEVDRNTSAITSITSQLSALVSDVNTNTSAIASINTQLGQMMEDWSLLGESDDTIVVTETYSDARYSMDDPFNSLKNKDVMIILKITDTSGSPAKDTFRSFLFDGSLLAAFHGTRLSHVLVGSTSEWSGSSGSTNIYKASIYVSNANTASKGCYTRVWNNMSTNITAKISIYTKTKPTPPTRTVKKKANAKKKGETI